MSSDSLKAVLAALAASGARFLVVGGVAVVAHGFVRLTEDLDLVLRLDDPNQVRLALRTLAMLGYQPIVPVPLESFADPRLRAEWVREKHAQVFQVYSDRHPALPIDLFLEAPFDLDRAFADAVAVTFDAIEVSVASIDDLVAMKRRAARPKDLDDIEHLEALRRWGQDEGP